MAKRPTKTEAFRAETPEGARWLRPLRLTWEGGGIPPAHIPLRDLDEGDLHRVHRVRALLASGGEPVGPATSEDLEAIAAELSSTGAWSREAIPTETPADPAAEE